MDEALHPCRSCGGIAEVHEYFHAGTAFVGQCTQCANRAAPSSNRQRAIDFWQAWNAPLVEDEPILDDTPADDVEHKQ